MKVAIYCRVSTAEQDTANQLLALEKLAKDRGWEVVEVYQEEASAWKDGHQLELSRLLKDASRHRFEAVLVWALDRMTRQGVGSILQLVNTLRMYRVKVISYQDSWTQFPNEAMEELFYAVAGWAAKFESDRRSERIKAGVARRRAAGKPVGRPKGAKDKKPRKKTGYYGRYADRR
ncbi:MAG: recombinase family protein [Dehalococcoidia bacterium]|nr:recombinase family protein [Dehalococcoidia bacterium]